MHACATSGLWCAATRGGGAAATKRGRPADVIQYGRNRLIFSTGKVFSTGSAHVTTGSTSALVALQHFMSMVTQKVSVQLCCKAVQARSCLFCAVNAGFDMRRF